MLHDMVLQAVAFRMKWSYVHFRGECEESRTERAAGGSRVRLWAGFARDYLQEVYDWIDVYRAVCRLCELPESLPAFVDMILIQSFIEHDCPLLGLECPRQKDGAHAPPDADFLPEHRAKTVA